MDEDSDIFINDEAVEGAQSVRGPSRELLEFEKQMEQVRLLARSGRQMDDNDMQKFSENETARQFDPAQNNNPPDIKPKKKITEFKLIIPDSGFSIILPAVWTSENQDGLSVIFDDGVKISAELGSRCKIRRPNGKETDALFAISAPLPDKTEMCAFFYCQPDNANSQN